jgi:hypothetical protein
MKAKIYFPHLNKTIDYEDWVSHYDFFIHTETGESPISIKIDKNGISVFTKDRDGKEYLKTDSIVVNGSSGYRFSVPEKS